MAPLLRGRALFWTAVAAYAAGFSALSVLRHRAFETGRFDLGNMVQAVWATAHGHPLRITSLEGEQISRLAAHVDPVLVLWAPLWRVWPSPDLLVVSQAILIALGAVPVWRLALRRLGSEWAALGFSLAYLLYPATQWLTLNEFHPVALACPLLLAAIDALDDGRMRAGVIWLALGALTKEEVGLVVAGIGIWLAVSEGRRRAGWLVACAGAAWTAVAVLVVVPAFNEHGSPFTGRYTEARAAFPNPWELLRVAWDHDAWRYVVELVLPLAGLCLLAPVLALAAAPEVALNVLSSAPTQSSIHFHYTAAEIPVLVAAAVLGAQRLWDRRGVATVLVAVALVANWRLGPNPLWRFVPGGETLQADAARVSEHDRIAARALRLIPDGTVVSATNSLGAHLSARRRVLSFPYVYDATWIAADETRPGYADRIAPVPTATQLAWLRRNPAWRLVFEQDGILVFHRVSPP